jgi:hypothetical protein
MTNRGWRFAVWALALLALASSGTVRSQGRTPERAPDNGTDPTRVSRTALVTYERMRLKESVASDLFRLNLTIPVGPKDDYSLRFRLPVTRLTGVGGNESFDVGDASIMLGHVFGLSQRGGYVAQLEYVSPTAARPELGTGKDVLKGTFIVARFLDGGSIFAPALVQANSIGGRADRPDVKATTIDLYYVPKLSDPRNLLTFDPSLNFDWETSKRFAGLAITYGRIIGKAFGGNAIVTVKPSANFGGERIFAGERSATWGIELGYKVIGF